jgi:capsular polysaccharide export protein
MGYYFDARNPSRLETFLNSEESKLSERESDRARTLIEKIILNGITKYNYRPPSPPSSFVFPSNGVLLVDQKSNDASIEFGAASEKTFELMIQAAIQENPDAPIFLKLHPDNRGRNRHTFDGRVSLLPDECKLTGALDQCAKLYVVTSQVGFEGVLRGKEVHVFGLPFYSGWGLTHDRQRLPRRARALSVEELFHAACIRQSIYVDPRTGKLIDLEDALDFILEMRDGVRMPSITAA